MGKVKVTLFPLSFVASQIHKLIREIHRIEPIALVNDRGEKVAFIISPTTYNALVNNHPDWFEK